MYSSFIHGNTPLDQHTKSRNYVRAGKTRMKGLCKMKLINRA